MKILIMSDSPTLTSGFANVSREIGNAFYDMGVEVEQIAFGLQEKVDYKFPLHPVPQNDFGLHIFSEVVERFLPDIVFTFADLQNIAWVSSYKAKFYKHWAYFPVDSEKLTRTQALIINSLDLPIVYSRSALYAVTLDTNRLDTKLIYHGVWPDKFKPVDNKESLKAQYGLKNKFVVGSVGRNITRKNFPALIKAFEKFAENKDDVVLYLHTKLNDFFGHNLYDFISQSSVKDKIITTKDLNSVNGVEVNDLSKIYNLFDIFVSTTAGEGLGLPILESQLCEVPVLVTDYSACKEFVPKKMRINVKAYYYEGCQWNVQRAIIDEDDLVKKLNFYYQNRSILPMIGKQCRQYIKDWDWKYIYPLWKYLIIQNGGKQQDSVLSRFIKI